MSHEPARSALAAHWTLDPGVAFLNHGSFGACPRAVLDVQAELRERMEYEPVRFLDHELEARLDEARQALAAFLGARPADLGFVPNATAGVNTVLRSLEPAFAPGDELLTTDHEYNACRNALHEVAAAAGGRVVTARVPFPLAAAEEVVAAVVAGASPHTRLAVISHITSPTGLLLPIERIAGALAERGVETLVDGAHAPGMVPLALDRLAELGVAYYTGNCHKWLCAPKGSGFLWVRRDRQSTLRPLVISHGANSPRARARFLLEFDWTGTADPTPFLAVPAAIDFMGRLLPGRWPELMAANHRLAVDARDLLCHALRSAPPAPDDMLGSMAAVILPAGIQPPAPEVPADAPAGSSYPEDRLNDVLYQRHRVEVPIWSWPGVPTDYQPRRRLVRVSAQAYNSPGDYERLAAALTDPA